MVSHNDKIQLSTISMHNSEGTWDIKSKKIPAFCHDNENMDIDVLALISGFFVIPLCFLFRPFKLQTHGSVLEFIRKIDWLF